TEKTKVFGGEADAFHIYIPETIVYGYEWSRNGEITIGKGTFINIRSFEKPYADYTGDYMDSPFMFDLKIKKRAVIKPAPAPAPEPVPEPEPELEPVPEPEPEPAVIPGPDRESPEEEMADLVGHDEEPKPKKRWWRAVWITLLVIVGIALLAVIALAVIGRVAPEWMDGLLYSQQELDIIYNK
ncbi:MAG: hypothetical protein J6X99_06375, partial [Bacteroidales bacterium]|nr:hypothetical protein [Bacteroidales bacterium]